MQIAEKLFRQNTLSDTFVAVRNLLLIILSIVVIATAVRHFNHLLASSNLTGHGGDYAIFAEFARQLADGGRIYVDYWDTKPPGLFFFLTPFVLLFGNTVFAIHLASVTLFLLFATGIFGLSLTLTWSRFAALLAAAIALLYTTYQRGPETTFAMMTFGTWAMFLAAAARGRTLWLFASGMVFALGCLTKQPLVVELPILLLVAIWRSKPGSGRAVRAALSVAGGIAAVGIAVVIWAASLGILDAMIYRVVRISAQYVFTDDGGWHFREDTQGLLETYLLRQAWPYLRPLALVAAVAIVGLALRARRQRGWLIALVWLAASLAGASIARGWRADYFTQALPSLLTLVAFGAASSGRFRQGWQVILTGVCLVAANLFIPPYANASIATARTMPEEDAVIEVVLSSTDEDDCIWTWGSLAVVNYLTGRDSCASAALDAFVMDSTAFPVVETRIEYMQEMAYAMPSVLIQAFDWGYFPELQKYTDRYRGELLLESARYHVYDVDRSSWHALETPVNFGGEVALIGYDIFDAPAEVCPGDTLQLALTWQHISRPTHEYQVFVQLLTPDEQAKIAGYDGVPVSRRPTYTWVNSGEVILGEPFELTIPETTREGTYPLVAGLYDVETTEPVSAQTSNDAKRGNYAIIAQIKVVNDCASIPE